MKFRTFAAAAAIALALTGTGYAACEQQMAAYQQFAPPNPNQGANSAAYQQSAPPNPNQGANSVDCK